MKKFYSGVYLIILSAIGFGIMPIFALYTYKYNINISTILFLRFFLAALFFFSLIWLTNKKITVTCSQIIALFAMGGFFYTLQSTFYFTSLKFISPSLTALLLYTYPIIVSLLSFFIFKEKLTKWHFLALFMTFMGLTLILGFPTGKTNLLGVFLALGAAIVYSCYILMGDHLLQKIPPIITSAFVTIFSTFSFLIICLSTKTFHFNFAPQTWFPILGIVLFSTIIAILSFFKGLELTGPTTACILSNLEPLITISLSMLLFHEKLTGYQLIGSMAVILGAIIVVLAKKPFLSSPKMNFHKNISNK